MLYESILWLDVPHIVLICIIQLLNTHWYWLTRTHWYVFTWLLHNIYSHCPHFPSPVEGLPYVVRSVKSLMFIVGRLCWISSFMVWLGPSLGSLTRLREIFWRVASKSFVNSSPMRSSRCWHCRSSSFLSVNFMSSALMACSYSSCVCSVSGERSSKSSFGEH